MVLTCSVKTARMCLLLAQFEMRVITPGRVFGALAPAESGPRRFRDLELDRRESALDGLV